MTSDVQIQRQSEKESVSISRNALDPVKREETGANFGFSFSSTSQRSCARAHSLRFVLSTYPDSGIETRARRCETLEKGGGGGGGGGGEAITDYRSVG